jgi:hypothetical protein
MNRSPSISSPNSLKLVVGWALAGSLCLLLIDFRYVCAEPQRLQTNILFALLFSISVACLYVTTRILLPKILGMFWLFFFLILALFPYRLFFDKTARLCDYLLYSNPPLILGLSRPWLLALIALMALALTAFVWFRKKKYPWALPKREIIVSLLLLLLVIIQMGARANDRALYDADGNVKFNCKGLKCKVEFFGHCVICDVHHHTIAGGIYKGVPGKESRYDKLVNNRRGLCHFMYSIIEPYTDPFTGVVLVNGFFFYIIVLSAYALGRYLRLDRSVAVAFAVLLAANKMVHMQAMVVAFYIVKTAFAFLILTAGYKLRIFSRQRSLKSKLLFASILVCSALVYDPYIYVAFLCFWACFQAAGQKFSDWRKAAWIILMGLAYSLVPIVAQSLFEGLLSFYGLTGNFENMSARQDILDKLPLLPAYCINNFWKVVKLTADNLVTLLYHNPRKMEYIPFMGTFGVVACFVFVPLFLTKKQYGGVYAIFLATLAIPLLAMLAASIPPHWKYRNIYTHMSRTTDYLTILALAQSLGLYWIAKFCSRWLPRAVKAPYLVYGAASFFYVKSLFISL